MSVRKRSKWRLRLFGVLLLIAAGLWAAWSQQAKREGTFAYNVIHKFLPMFGWWIAAALLLVAVLAGWRWVRRRSPAGQMRRWTEESKRNEGLATWWQVWRWGGWYWVKRNAHAVRPDWMAGKPRWKRWLLPVEIAAMKIVRAGLLWIWILVEDITIAVGPARSGKTGFLTNLVIDAPGAVLATSTKIDIIDLTRPLREKLGPTAILNPQGIGGLDHQSTLYYNPVFGCEDPAVASDNAAALLAGSPAMTGVGSREFWEGQTVRVLTAMMHAAALGDLDARALPRWVSDPDGTAREVLEHLGKSPLADSMRNDYQQFVSTNVNTRSSITTGIMACLQWLNDPKIARIALGTKEQQFDIEAHLRSRGTVYLIAEDKRHGSVAPLFSVFTAAVFSTAKMMASRSVGGRLAPSLLLALDEAPLICPVPLERWAADSGGRGIQLAIGAQSRAQLFWKWGEEGGRIIWGQATATIIFPGVNDEVELAAYADMSGTKIEMAETTDRKDNLITRTEKRTTVLDPGTIRKLKPWQVLVFRRYLPPVLGRVTPSWERKDVRAAQARAGQLDGRTSKIKRKKEPKVPKQGAKTGAPPVQFDDTMLPVLDMQDSGAGEK